VAARGGVVGVAGVSANNTAVHMESQQTLET